MKTQIETRSGWNEVPIEVEYYLDIWGDLTGSGKVDCGKDKDGNWWAQFSYRIAIDDYSIDSYQFNTKPTAHIVQTARRIENLRLDISIRRFPLNFQCWECGRETHWLDVSEDGTSPSFERKIEMTKENYCGC